jgi:hypothetical protein
MPTVGWCRMRRRSRDLARKRRLACRLLSSADSAYLRTAIPPTTFGTTFPLTSAPIRSYTDKQLQLLPGAVTDAQPFLRIIPRFALDLTGWPNLVEGFETPFGFEFLSTVHRVANREPVNTINDVIAKTYGWGDRKRQFSERQLHLALDRLVKKKAQRRTVRESTMKVAIPN